MYKSLSIFLLFCFVSLTGFSQPMKYSRVKIFTNEEGLGKLAEKGVGFDHGEAKKGVYFISDFSANEVRVIRESGYKFDILIDDVSKFYAQQNNDNTVLTRDDTRAPTVCDKSFTKSPSHFHLGDYAGFFSYDQLLVILDSMQMLYPQLISKRQPIDNTTTAQGRSLYWLRISNKPNVDQDNKPEVFYNALHHAREPASLSQLIYYMWYILDNYNTDPEVKGIVDNMEMYFVPCINPDGYVANIKSNPSGGGMQRKNSKGVDINRNYDLYWGYDNQGSSNSPGADNYRGPSAGSEAETKMMKNFCIAHHFKLAISCHAFGNYLIHSWAYKASTPTADAGIFTNYGKFMTEENKYQVGTPSATVGYTGNGASSDWFYNENSQKGKIFEYSPEAGKGSFYPAKNQILGICKDMLFVDYKVAKLALKYVIVSDTHPYYINNKNGNFNFSFKSLVPDSLAKFTVTIVPISPEITAVGGAKSYSNTVINTTGKDSISFTLDPGIKQGTILKYLLKVNNTAFTHTDTITKMYGNPSTLLSDNGNSMNEWISSSGWGLSTTVFHTPSSSITDSPTGNYTNNTNSTLTSKTEIDLSTMQSALLSFWAKWNIEQGFDYVQLSASIDNGQNWIPLCGKYTSTGTSTQDLGNPIYDGTSDWVKEEVNLTQFAGKKILLRFLIKTDGQNLADGFYLDDILVQKIDSSVIGIKEQDAVISVSSSMPNPADEFTYITFQTNNAISGDSKLIVYNAVGQLFYTQQIHENDATLKLETSKWPQGIYYYSVQKGRYASAVNKLCITHAN